MFVLKTTYQNLLARYDQIKRELDARIKEIVRINREFESQQQRLRAAEIHIATLRQQLQNMQQMQEITIGQLHNSSPTTYATTYVNNPSGHTSRRGFVDVDAENIGGVIQTATEAVTAYTQKTYDTAREEPTSPPVSSSRCSRDDDYNRSSSPSYYNSCSRDDDNRSSGSSSDSGSWSSSD